MRPTTKHILAALLLTAGACAGSDLDESYSIEGAEIHQSGDRMTIIREDARFIPLGTGDGELQEVIPTKIFPLRIELAQGGTHSGLRGRADIGDTAHTARARDADAEIPDPLGLSAELDGFRVWRRGYMSLESELARPERNAGRARVDVFGKGPLSAAEAAETGYTDDDFRDVSGAVGDIRVVADLEECSRRPFKVDLKMTHAPGAALAWDAVRDDDSLRGVVEERLFGGSPVGATEQRELDGAYGTRDLTRATFVRATAYLYCADATFRAELFGQVQR